MAIKPILFNTEMVRAILEGRKSCTRRLVKPQPKSKLCYTFAGSDSNTWGYPNRTAHEIWGEEFKLPNDITEEELSKRWNPPYHTDDILYVRETWKKAPNGYYYYEDWQRNDIADVIKWKPSIHMPKEAARIWLKVTDVRVERLQDTTDDDAEAEGCFDYTSTALGFFDVWDSTIKKSNLNCYGWNANPWVWVIEFERCVKPKI
nr:MAG TPA: ASCH domain protein [Caudoviricetes sp.]